MDTSVWERRYPNAGEGAIRFLDEASVWNLAKAKATAVPDVEGVWLITNIILTNCEPGQAIVYLKGYPDDVGQIRQINAFCEAESDA